MTRKILAATAVVMLGLAACNGTPARLVVGVGDTVLINNVRPVRLPVQVLDASGHVLPPDSSVRYRWTSGIAIPVSAAGVVTCTTAGDATLRASLGEMATSVLLRCRPVQRVVGGGLLQLVLGDPAPELRFEALGLDGGPVTLLATQVTVRDTTVLTLDGWRIHPRRAGYASVDVGIGDRDAFFSVIVYQPVQGLAEIRPGQHLAVRVRLAGGEVRSWQLPAAPQTYALTMRPDGTGPVPQLGVVGANCDHGPFGDDCLARHGASVMVYHPRPTDPAHAWSGTLLVSRGAIPRERGARGSVATP
jgi:hypothetical protein